MSSEILRRMLADSEDPAHTCFGIFDVTERAALCDAIEALRDRENEQWAARSVVEKYRDWYGASA